MKEILLKKESIVGDGVFWGEANLGGWYTEKEIEAVVKTLRNSSNWRIGFGYGGEIQEFESAFAKYCGTKYAIMLNSCGAGLDLLMKSLNLEEGDEVICPAINYKAAHLAILGQGGTVVFCDIDPQTLNLDPYDVEKRITSRTRAIFPVHMNGVPAPVDELMTLAQKNPHDQHGPLKVIGDAARSCGAKHADGTVGSKGWATAFSFHSQKLMTTLGEGGAITTNDAELASRLRDLRQFGGEEAWGSNYKMTAVQAAAGIVQLKRLDEMNNRRIQIARKRTEILNGKTEATLPHDHLVNKNVFYVYGIVLPQEWAGKKRNQMIAYMKDNYSIACSVTNPPTYQRWPYIREMCGNPNLPISEDVGSRLICLPIHPLMTSEQDEYVCEAFLDAYKHL